MRIIDWSSDVCSSDLLALGYPVAASFVAGTGFVLTSTAIVMQMLDERRAMGQPKGRRIIVILLLEDLAIVPLLALTAFLAPGGEAVSLTGRLISVAHGLGAIDGLTLAGDRKSTRLNSHH